MRNILGRDNLRVLTGFAHARVLLAFGYDGVLAPVHRDRFDARPRTSTIHLLKRLCELYPCAVLSGRTRADLLLRLGAAAPVHVVGNHGLEAKDAGMDPLWSAGIVPDLMRALEHERGVEIEDRGYSVAIRYHQATAKVTAQQRVLSVARSFGEACRIIEGRFAANLLPTTAPHKRDALAALVVDEGVDALIYVGEHESDDGSLGTSIARWTLRICVGQTQRPEIRYYIRTQRKVDAFLRFLMNERSVGIVRRRERHEPLGMGE